jgi:NADH dehydrogenase FAD-containing subunit
VGSTLPSIADARLFAAGDCASLEGYRLPKLGVSGVRQAPILLHKLVALLGGRPLMQYRPQSRYLTFLNLGCGRALAVYGNLHWLGRFSYWIKDRIDRRFLARYRR